MTTEFLRDKRGQYIDPKGQLEGSFSLLMEAQCIQAEMPELETMFYSLMHVSLCNPCAGCPVWAKGGPSCKAFQKYHTAYQRVIRETQVSSALAKEATKPRNVPPGHPLFGLSVKQIAQKLCISIGEVRRRKQAGTL